MGAVLEDRKVMQLHFWSAEKLATEPLPPNSAVLRMADDHGLFPEIFDKENATAVHSICFADTEWWSGVENPPCMSHAAEIVGFYKESQKFGRESFVAQCQAGIGRSVAVCMALNEIQGGRRTILHPAYNRKLYRDILRAGGLEPPAEPLVSIAVRVKYHPDCIDLFLKSLRRQRYSNWEAVVFADGSAGVLPSMIRGFGDDRIYYMPTPESRGRWGHPYRQMAFEQCKGEWIGTNNDDNYLTPGYIEQLVETGEAKKADIVLCQSVHRYMGWGVAGPGSDLCTWIARADLVHDTPWTGTGFTADRDYLKAMMDKGVRVATIERPLVVKN